MCIRDRHIGQGGPHDHNTDHRNHSDITGISGAAQATGIYDLRNLSVSDDSGNIEKRNPFADNFRISGEPVSYTHLSDDCRLAGIANAA